MAAGARPRDLPFAVGGLSAFSTGMTPTVAIVGRPNVGKSALFNRLAGRRIAIVHDQPGVTRDRVSAELELEGRPYTLVDTGGIGLLAGEKTGDPIVQAALAQVQVAIESADLILFVVDAKEGVAPLDEDVAERLRECGRPVLLVVNKVDNPREELMAADFARLGFDPVWPVSAIHGHGVPALLQAMKQHLPPPTPDEAAAAPGEPSPEPSEAAEAGGEESLPGMAGPLKLAFVGRPNVGKSSLVNALTRSERVVVSPVPGTTRDSVDVPLQITTEGRVERYILIDTAGMRKARRIKDSIEFYSVRRAEKSIERADLVVFVLDAETGIVEQDKKIADKIVSAHKACVVVINKWDLYAEQVEAARRELEQLARKGKRPPDAPPARMSDFVAWVKRKLFFLDYAPVVFTSATEGMHLDRLLDAVRFVADQLRQTVPTALLNRVLHEAIEKRQPISATGERLRFFYATQIGRAPARFLLFVNKAGLFAPAYVKYLTGELRRAFGFEGCPILITARPRPKKVDFTAAKKKKDGRRRTTGRKASSKKSKPGRGGRTRAARQGRGRR
ncbi:MAG: ribosome biogenesis GTPase Der [Verrucomicrobia bacterium]|nr:MAG: ribosome biogenesis GTPase Der [Verrucomicrobiota bacterium]